MIKRLLGDLPLTAEVYWQLRQQGKPLNKSISMQDVSKKLPEWSAQVRNNRQVNANPKKILLFTTLRYWIEHATLFGLGLSGFGHQVLLAYLPYTNWQKSVSRFDLRRHNAYIRSVLDLAGGLITPVPFFDRKQVSLPLSLVQAIRQVSIRDVQYTLQIEDVDTESTLFQLRTERNLQAASAAWSWIRESRPNLLLTPNGSILEMGAVYQVARYLGIPIVTYEFGEQRGRIWLAQDDEVMLQRTDDLWAGRANTGLDDSEMERIQALYVSRQNASLWENFSRRWQGLPSQGGEKTRASLALDERPVVLLAANVIGDSLTLGRQVFSENMTEWLKRTIGYFSERPDVQFVVRIHPGERYTKGPSVADVIQQVTPLLPANIHLVAAGDPVNTYDLIDIADLGLVYTTTVGMEMAMSGTSVVVAGQTHYRGKGFTLDPRSWEQYFEMLDRLLQNLPIARPERVQTELAWRYAYLFFFKYPLPFPWHLLHFRSELDEWSMERVLSPAGQSEFGETFRCLAGEPRNWTN